MKQAACLWMLFFDYSCCWRVCFLEGSACVCVCVCACVCGGACAYQCHFVGRGPGPQQCIPGGNGQVRCWLFSCSWVCRIKGFCARSLEWSWLSLWCCSYKSSTHYCNSKGRTAAPHAVGCDCSKNWDENLWVLRMQLLCGVKINAPCVCPSYRLTEIWLENLVILLGVHFPA